jgi:hypothetical protein
MSELPPAAPALKAMFLLNDISGVGVIGVVDTKDMPRTQSFQAFSDPDDAEFDVKIEGSMDGIHWFSFGSIDGPGIRSEGQHSLQFLRATLMSIDHGASVTVLVSWK